MTDSLKHFSRSAFLLQIRTRWNSRKCLVERRRRFSGIILLDESRKIFSLKYERRTLLKSPFDNLLGNFLLNGLLNRPRHWSCTHVRINAIKHDCLNDDIVDDEIDTFITQTFL